MKKNTLFFLGIIFSGLLSAQNSFPYNQDWGTYVGGTGTLLYDQYIDGNSFHADSQNNLYVSGNTTFANGYMASYYNQFVLGGGNNATLPDENDYAAKFSVTGQMLYGSYTGNGIGNTLTAENLLGIDSSDNKYYIKLQQGLVPNLGTAGVLFAQNFATGTYTVTLSKYDSSHNLVWTTYLPNKVHARYTMRFDENQNIYLMSLTDESISGLGTSGVYQPDFISYTPSVGNSVINGYLVKLNPAGQKIWATYAVAGFVSIEYYNGGIYTISGYEPNMPGILTTPGTFQPNQSAKQLLMKFDANSGQRVWGTFYGTPTLGYTGLGNYALKVNSTGLYISGQSEDTAYPTYFASSGAFQSQLSGGGDLYLSKFSHDGNRVWSTYFGSTGYEEILGSTNLALFEDKIVITGNQYGNSVNLSTPGAFQATPANANNSNMFFAEFDSSGNRLWASYFGGATSTSFYGEQISPEFLNDGSLLLWGGSSAQTGIATSNGYYSTMLNPSPGQPFGFITKFTPKQNEMATSEAGGIASDLVLYNNPNNGIFTLDGKILGKEPCRFLIYDASGRMLHQQEMKKEKKQTFNLQSKLTAGNYLLQVENSKKQKIKVFKLMIK